MPISQKKIDDFLASFRKAVSKRGGEIHFIERSEINKDLASLEITAAQATKEVLSLKNEHYQKGPEADKDAKKFPNEIGDIWVFEKEINSKKAYIKLKLAESVHNSAIVFPKCFMHESVTSNNKKNEKKAPDKIKKGGKK